MDSGLLANAQDRNWVQSRGQPPRQQRSPMVGRSEIHQVGGGGGGGGVPKSVFAAIDTRDNAHSTHALVSLKARGVREKRRPENHWGVHRRGRRAKGRKGWWQRQGECMSIFLKAELFFGLAESRQASTRHISMAGKIFWRGTCLRGRNGRKCRCGGGGNSAIAPVACLSIGCQHSGSSGPTGSQPEACQGLPGRARTPDSAADSRGQKTTPPNPIRQGATMPSCILKL